MHDVVDRLGERGLGEISSQTRWTWAGTVEMIGLGDSVLYIGRVGTAVTSGLDSAREF